MCRHVWVGTKNPFDTNLRCLRCRGHTTLQNLYASAPHGEPLLALVEQTNEIMAIYQRIYNEGTWGEQC